MIAARKAALHILACSAVLQLLFPSTTNQFRVRTISEGHGLKLKISKSSPPVAALEDAQLVIKEVIPGKSITLEPVPSKVRVLPGIRISRREVDRQLAEETSKEAITEAIQVQKVAVNPILPNAAEATHEYSKPRQPKIINFKELMNKVRGESTGATTVAALDAAAPAAVGMVAVAPVIPPLPAAKSSSAAAPMTESAYSIKGQIVLDGAIPADGQLLVYREVNGRRQDTVILEKGNLSFHLKAERLIGLLVAELRSSEDVLLAKYERSLDFWAGRGQKIEGVSAKLKQVSGLAARGRVSSASGTEFVDSPVVGVSIKSGSAETTSTKSGGYEISGLSPDSSLIVKAEKKGFVGTLMLASARQSLPVQLYPEKMVSALIDIAGTPHGFSMKEFARSGIVWGRVNSRVGQPIDNARVEMADSDAIGPIYFNDFFLPDSSRTATSKNGLFVFLRVKPGTGVIRAVQNGKMMPTRIFPVEAGFVSHVELEAAEKRGAQVITVDAFSHQPQPSEIRFAGAARSAKTNASGALKTYYSKSSDPLILEVEAQDDYKAVRFHAARDSDTYIVPLIRDEWLNYLKINQGADTGIVIGFIRGQRADVFMDIDGRAHQEILYFNASGEIVPVPVDGGGFIMSNVPVGMRTISMVAEGSPAIFNQVISVDSSLVSVISKEF